MTKIVKNLGSISSKRIKQATSYSDSHTFSRNACTEVCEMYCEFETYRHFDYLIANLHFLPSDLYPLLNSNLTGDGGDPGGMTRKFIGD